MLAAAALRAVGWKHRKKEAPGLQPAPAGVALSLVRDPANAYDSDAIKVMHGADDIGFLEAAVAKQLAPLLFDNAASAGAVRLEARCQGMQGTVGHELVLRVFARDGGAPVPPALAEALRRFAAAHPVPGTPEPPVQAHLRGQLREDGRVHGPPPGANPREWARANKPSTWAPSACAWIQAHAPGRSADTPRCGKWCVAQRTAACGLHTLLAHLSAPAGCSSPPTPSRTRCGRASWWRCARASSASPPRSRRATLRARAAWP
jgi:hypothetical protein